MNPVPALAPTFTISQAQVLISATHPLRVQRTVSRQVPLHDHDYHEIGLVGGGAARHLISTGTTGLHRGSVLVVPPGQVHGFATGRDFQITNVYYLAEWLLAELRPWQEPDGLVPLFLGTSLFPGAFPTPIRQFDLSAGALADCLRELAGIEEELARAIPSLVFLKSMFLKFLVYLSRAFVAQAERPFGFHFCREVSLALDGIERALEEIHPFQVAETARRLGLSAAGLTRLFKQETGRAPMEYFQSRRIQRACVQLLNPAVSITEVAHGLGYADAAHFCRLFSRFQKRSPRAYRQRYGVGAAQPPKRPGPGI